MHTHTTTARPAANMEVEEVLFEGKTPIGRTYRVTAVAPFTLKIYRDFDFAPGDWHLEGTVRHDPADWLGPGASRGARGRAGMAAPAYGQIIDAARRLVRGGSWICPGSPANGR